MEGLWGAQVLFLTWQHQRGTEAHWSPHRDVPRCCFVSAGELSEILGNISLSLGHPCPESSSPSMRADPSSAVAALSCPGRTNRAGGGESERNSGMELMNQNPPGSRGGVCTLCGALMGL